MVLIVMTFMILNVIGLAIVFFYDSGAERQMLVDSENSARVNACIKIQSFRRGIVARRAFASRRARYQRASEILSRIGQFIIGRRIFAGIAEVRLRHDARLKEEELLLASRQWATKSKVLKFLRNFGKCSVYRRSLLSILGEMEMQVKFEKCLVVFEQPVCDSFDVIRFFISLCSCCCMCVVSGVNFLIYHVLIVLWISVVYTCIVVFYVLVGLLSIIGSFSCFGVKLAFELGWFAYYVLFPVSRRIVLFALGRCALVGVVCSRVGIRFVRRAAIVGINCLLYFNCSAVWLVVLRDFLLRADALDCRAVCDAADRRQFIDNCMAQVRAIRAASVAADVSE